MVLSIVIPSKNEGAVIILRMHAMGPNVAGVIGSAVAAGIMILFAS